MKILTPEFQKTVADLIKNFSLDQCNYPDEMKLARDFNALPIGEDMWSFVLLTPNGESIYEDVNGNIVYSKDVQELIRVIVAGSKRFPELAVFIPIRPNESKVCPVCEGAKIWGKRTSDNKSARCVVCAGLGWITVEEYSKMNNEFPRGRAARYQNSESCVVSFFTP